MAEVNKELDFDLNASSPIHVSVVENRDLYLTCAFTKPLRRHRISFLSLKDFGLLYIGQARQGHINYRLFSDNALNIRMGHIGRVVRHKLILLIKSPIRSERLPRLKLDNLISFWSSRHAGAEQHDKIFVLLKYVNQ